MNSEILNLMDAASEHADRLKADILLCKTREEHVRLTARANEAVALVSTLVKFFGEQASE